MPKTIDTVNTIAIFNRFDLDVINEELTARSLPTTEEVATGAMLLATGVRSLDEFAATVINLTHGEVNPDDLREDMMAAFPNHKIGDRHAPHYLSLARKGNLQGNVECRYQPPKATRKARPSKGVAIDLAAMTPEQRATLATISPELEAAVAAWEAAN